MYGRVLKWFCNAWFYFCFVGGCEVISPDENHAVNTSSFMELSGKEGQRNTKQTRMEVVRRFLLLVESRGLSQAQLLGRRGGRPSRPPLWTKVLFPVLAFVDPTSEGGNHTEGEGNTPNSLGDVYVDTTPCKCAVECVPFSICVGPLASTEFILERNTNKRVSFPSDPFLTALLRHELNSFHHFFCHHDARTHRVFVGTHCGDRTAARECGLLRVARLGLLRMSMQELVWGWLLASPPFAAM